MSARIHQLKEELKHLPDRFPGTHPTLSVKAPSLDELRLQFKDGSGSVFELTCNIPENYPENRPLWFSETDNPVVSQVLEELNSEEIDIPRIKMLEKSVAYLVRRLCEFFGIQVPHEAHILWPSHIASGEGNGDNGIIEVISSDEDMDLGLEEVDTVRPKEEGISNEQLKRLEKLRSSQKVQRSSIPATDRLMKELKTIYKSDSFKNGIFTVDVIEDNIYDWNVSLLRVDPDSPLAKDLQKLPDKEKHIKLHIHFDHSFPFTPPFIRVVSPVIKGGYVLSGGAICMELLTKEGWSSAYSIESVIMQISATFTKGKARITFQSNAGSSYSLHKAQATHRSLVQLHKKSGWYTPPKEDG